MRFKSVEHLLAWAFEMSKTPICKTAKLDQREQMGRVSLPREVMTPHDRHAQAARVIAFVSTLPVAEKMVICGLYDQDLRQSACIVLADQVECRYGMQSALYACKQWLTPQLRSGRRGHSDTHLAELAGCSPTTARRYRHEVWDELDTIFGLASGMLEDRFSVLLCEQVAIAA